MKKKSSLPKLKISESQDSEKNTPAILYKYRNWKSPHHSRLLTDNEVFFTSPKDFNDPFDCRITENFLEMTGEEKKHYVNQLGMSMFTDTERRGLNFEKIFRGLDERMEDGETFQTESEKQHFSMQDDYYGVFSLSKVWDSVLMWSHYSNNHKGFCVGIKGTSLLKWHDRRAKGGPVQYYQDYPEIKPKAFKTMDSVEQLNRMFIETHSKSDEWCYEKEYRVSKNFYGLKSFERKDFLPPNSIVEIILGVLISDDDKKKILDFALEHSINAYQAKKVSLKFKLTREPIFTF